ncbi:type VI secretion system Vgr family protein [Undibacterium curvum]|uniref:type VI secretion system Vgr family protein n=1 Tax=Undibacterium curvum TaxID=2762294 RepID=UPI003D102F00
MPKLFHHPRALSISGPAVTAGGLAGFSPLSLSGSDGINALFSYTLRLQSSDVTGFADLGLGAEPGTAFHPDQVIGKEITCHIELEGRGSFVSGLPGGAAVNVGAGVRELSALVTEARFVGLDSRHAVIECTLQPWLHLASLSSDCKVFQNQTPVDTILAVLADYPFAVERRLIERYPLRDYCVQYNETDLEFVVRLMQEWGINYHFEHSAGVHRLILSDHNAAFRTASAAYATLPYYPPGHKTDRDYIHAFSPAHRLTSGSVASRDYDYTRPEASLDAGFSDPRPTGHANQEVYLWRDANAGSNYSQPNAGAMTQDGAANQTETEGDDLARIRLQERRQHGQRATGSAYLRGLVPGMSFTLTDYPQAAANIEYLILHTTFTLQNVSEDTQRDVQNNLQHHVLNVDTNHQAGLWQIQTDFHVQPSNCMLRPALTQAKPRSLGPEVARVTGPDPDTAANNLYTDVYGRIKIQFPWDRYGKRNHNSSCWVRVAQAWAGNQLGQLSIPRIGQEVLISFIGGDPDQPVCSGSLHNQNNLPPWQLPSQQALTGLRSRELTAGGGNASAGRSNHLILDDTAQQIQLQLKSDHQHSQLSLGHITRIDNNRGRQDPRGQGFELRTDGHGAMRAKDGLLISSEARPQAQNHHTSLNESAQRLQHAHNLHASLADAAQQAGAQEPSDQPQVAQDLEQQNAEIAGTANKANNTNNTNQNHFPEFSQPHILITSPSGIASTTAGSTQQHSAAQHAITAEQHISLSSGHNLLASARKAIRLFAYKAGMKLIAANGDVDIKALEKSIHVLAKLRITETAQSITINASKEVLINGGGSYTRWNAAGIEDGTSGAWSAHAAGHGWSGAKSMGVNMQGTPHVDMYDEKFVFHTPSGKPISAQSYTAKSSVGEHTGQTRADGGTPRIYTADAQALEVAAAWMRFMTSDSTNPNSSSDHPADTSGVHHDR